MSDDIRGLRDPHCTDCGAQYGMFHGLDCSFPGTWREGLAAIRDRERYEARCREQARSQAGTTERPARPREAPDNPTNTPRKSEEG